MAVIRPIYLPTGRWARWAIAGFCDSVLERLGRDRSSTELRIFMYAVTQGGWEEIRRAVRRWLRLKRGRIAAAYVGTDHGLTDPDALERMIGDGVAVHLMVNYVGVFHPKVLWLSGGRHETLWAGSNNLTREALVFNIEFATVTTFKRSYPALDRWYGMIQQGSVPATHELIEDYRRQRLQFGRSQAAAGAFTWRRRWQQAVPRVQAARRGRQPRASTGRAVLDAIITGDLVIEIMPRETGTAGSQIQLPKEVATRFFGLPNRVGRSMVVRLSNVSTRSSRSLRMTLFGNNTTRLSLRELEFGHRPCVVVFRKQAKRFDFEIVPEGIFPARYGELLRHCSQRTRAGSRRWGLVENGA